MYLSLHQLACTTKWKFTDVNKSPLFLPESRSPALCRPGWNLVLCIKCNSLIQDVVVQTGLCEDLVSDFLLPETCFIYFIFL